MTYNIIKVMKDLKSGLIMRVILLDGLSAVLEITELHKALNMALIFNRNSDSGWQYEVRGGGKTYDRELAYLTHRSKK